MEWIQRVFSRTQRCLILMNDPDEPGVYIYMGQRSWGMCLDKYKWNHKFETVWVLLASVSTRRQTFGGFFKMFMLYCIYWLNTQNGCSANSAMSWLVESTWLKTMGYPQNRYYNGEKEQHLTKISDHPSIQDDVGSHKVPGQPHPWQCQIQHTTSRLETFEEAHWEILGGLTLVIRAEMSLIATAATGIRAMWTPLAFWHLLSADFANWWEHRNMMDHVSWKCHPVPPASEHRWRKIVSKPSKPQTQQMCVDDSWSAFVQLRCDVQTSRRKGCAMSFSLTCVIIPHVKQPRWSAAKNAHKYSFTIYLYTSSCDFNWLLNPLLRVQTSIFVYVKQIKKSTFWIPINMNETDCGSPELLITESQPPGIHQGPDIPNSVLQKRCGAGRMQCRSHESSSHGDLQLKDPSVYLYVLFLFFSLSLSLCM